MASLRTYPACLAGFGRCADELYRVEFVGFANSQLRNRGALAKLAIDFEHFQPLLIWHQEKVEPDRMISSEIP